MIGCAAGKHYLATRLVAPPNGGHVHAPASADELRENGVSDAMRIDVGPPTATLDVWILRPDLRNAPRGTILALHGHGASKHQMLGIAHRFVEHGYAVVLVDHRGHGDSTGAHITFGAFESHDMKQLIDELERRHEIIDPVGTFGLSYGAAVAIQTAAIDPRVRAVVSVSGFSSMREVVPNISRIILPRVAWWIYGRDVNGIIDTAGQIAGFNADDASPIRAITSMKTPVLLMHGTSDGWIKPSHSQRLHDAAPDHSRLILINGADHFNVLTDAPDTIVPHEAIAWFDRWLTGTHD